jgi:8-oxo-dGTP diphosphatase
LLIDRANPPFGFAGPAGHVDEGEEPEQAVIREVSEETGLTVTNPVLAFEEFVSWNECRQGTQGHHWYVYQCVVEGELAQSNREAKSLGWYNVEQIKQLTLEPVWQHWFQKLGII